MPLAPALTFVRRRSTTVAIVLVTVGMLVWTPAPRAQTHEEKGVASTGFPSAIGSQPSVIVTSLLSGGFGLLGTLIALTFANRNTRLTIDASRSTSEASNNQKVNEAELAAIRSKLDTFYAPYLQRSAENRLLAEQVQAGQPASFRTPTSLLEPGWFDGLPVADKTIVDEIVANGLDLRALIRDRAGVTDPALLPYLALAGTHFTLLELARKGVLGGDPERFREFVYPRRLDPVLRLDMERLERRAALLRSSLMVLQPPIAALTIPSELRLDADLAGSEGAAPVSVVQDRPTPA